MVQSGYWDKCPINLSNSFEFESFPLKLEDSLAIRKKNENLRIFAIVLCIASALINLTICILSFVYATLRHSAATYAFAADCFLDLISSVIVIWRYFGSSHTFYSAAKENRACICLGIFFILAGLAVIGQGIGFLFLKEMPQWAVKEGGEEFCTERITCLLKYTLLVVLAGIGMVMCTLLGIAKYILYRKMNSRSLFLDALNSFLSALFAAVIIISDVVYYYNENIWYLDPILSIFLSLCLVAYGCRIALEHCRSQEE